MSENSVMQDTLLSQENSAENLSVSAGQMLKQARVDAGLHIAALAVSLRVPVKRIEALENGQMDLLPDMVFVRALTASICQTLKIDPLPILDKLPKVSVPRLNRDDVALNTPIESNANGKRALPSDAVTLPWIIGVAFLCIGAAIMYLMPKDFSFAIGEIATPSHNLTENTVIPTVQSQSNNGAVTYLNEALPSSGTQVIATPVSGIVPNVSSPPAVGNSVAKPSDSIVIFKVSSDAWVEVKNAKGNTTFKKLLKAGESAGTSGIVPLTVIVGRADVTQVEVRGKPIDLTSIAKSNVARFVVN